MVAPSLCPTYQSTVNLVRGEDVSLAAVVDLAAPLARLEKHRRRNLMVPLNQQEDPPVEVAHPEAEAVVQIGNAIPVRIQDVRYGETKNTSSNFDLDVKEIFLT